MGTSVCIPTAGDGHTATTNHSLLGLVPGLWGVSDMPPPFLSCPQFCPRPLLPKPPTSLCAPVQEARSGPAPNRPHPKEKKRPQLENQHGRGSPGRGSCRITEGQQSGAQGRDQGDQRSLGRVIPAGLVILSQGQGELLVLDPETRGALV